MVNLKNIKAVITDVDGVLTDGSIIIHEDGSESKSFNVKDGTLCGFMREQGIVLGIISGRSSDSVEVRAKQLGFHFTKQGVKDKRDALNEFKTKFDLTGQAIVFVGDDINDLVVKDHVGFFVCPSDAHIKVQAEADWKTSAKGGQGVLREIFDNIIEQNGWDVELQTYYNLNDIRKSVQ